MVHDVLAEQGQNASELTYHVWWPGPDPWYQADTAAINHRTAFYPEIYSLGIPAIFVDGQNMHWPITAPELQDSIEARLQLPSHLWMNIRGWANVAQDTVFMELMTVADTIIGPGTRLHMAVSEIYTHWDYPAPNGQQDFYAAFLRMYPNGNGQPFSHSGNIEDTVSFSGCFAVGAVDSIPWALDNLRFLAWVQDSVSKDVLQSQSLEFPYLFSPQPGETVYVDIPASIRWTTGALDSTVTLELMREYPSGTWETIAQDLPNSGSMEWMTTGPLSDHARLRIYSPNDSTASDTMDGDFIISNPATIEVSPNPVTYTLLAGEVEDTWIFVTNIGDVPAHGTVRADSGMSWGRPWLLSRFDAPIGGYDSVHVSFNASDITTDTVLTGVWIFSGNVLPFEVQVILTVIGSAAQGPALPLTFSVSEAYPNPFNPTTTVRLELEKATHVEMLIYNAVGQQIISVFSGPLPAGVHQQSVDGTEWASGTYFLRIDAGEHRQIRKLLLLK